MQDYNIALLQNETMLLVVTSTFGNGDTPDNGAVKYLSFIKNYTITINNSLFISSSRRI